MRHPRAGTHARSLTAVALVIGTGIALSGRVALADTAAPAPDQAKTEAAPTAAPATAAGGTDATSGGDADQWTYKMQNGQLYQPPKERAASPADNTSVYGRT